MSLDRLLIVAARTDLAIMSALRVEMIGLARTQRGIADGAKIVGRGVIAAPRSFLWFSPTIKLSNQLAKAGVTMTAVNSKAVAMRLRFIGPPSSRE
jgi:hypothetical protein